MNQLAFVIALSWAFFWAWPEFYGKQAGKFARAYRRALEGQGND